MGTPRENTKATYLDGTAVVKVYSSGLASVNLDETTYNFSAEQTPPLLFSGEMYVRLSQDASKFWDFKPAGGTHIVKFLKFSHKEDAPPEYSFKRGGPRPGYYEQDSYFTTALFEIVAGPFEGVIVARYTPLTDTSSNFLIYGAEDNATGETVTGFKVSSNTNARAYKLEDFMNKCGFDWVRDSIPWSDNILPELQKILRSKDLKVQATLSEKGWVNELVDLPMGL